MVKAQNDDIELQFAYDGIGNRIRKKIIENSDTTVVKYSYDGADLLFEQDDNDAVQIRYLYGPGIDHILESVDSVGTNQHFADALGTVTRITDNTGTRYKLMVYDSYGNMRSDTGSVQADYVSYTAREAERALGIYYYRARYYDPLTGRFITPDPLELADPDINLYRFVRNNPISFIDPLGLVTYPTTGPLRPGGEDGYGYGHFGANRTNRDGTRRDPPHQGVDYSGATGSAVFAPISGNIRRVGRESVWIEGTYNGRTYRIRLVHISDRVQTGTIEEGEVIGTIMDLDERWPGITPHAHVEVREVTNGQEVLIDPATFIPGFSRSRCYAVSRR
jgi:RHS repeat-associated protein